MGNNFRSNLGNVPTGTLEISSNGTYNVTEYAEAEVSVVIAEKKPVEPYMLDFNNIYDLDFRQYYSSGYTFPKKSVIWSYSYNGSGTSLTHYINGKEVATSPYSSYWYNFPGGVGTVTSMRFLVDEGDVLTESGASSSTGLLFKVIPLKDEYKDIVLVPDWENHGNYISNYNSSNPAGSATTLQEDSFVCAIPTYNNDSTFVIHKSDGSYSLNIDFKQCPIFLKAGTKVSNTANNNKTYIIPVKQSSNNA